VARGGVQAPAAGRGEVEHGWRGNENRGVGVWWRRAHRVVLTEWTRNFQIYQLNRRSRTHASVQPSVRC
jgi:hypothetical protein